MPDDELGELCVDHLDDRSSPASGDATSGAASLRTPIAYPVFLASTRRSAALRAVAPASRGCYSIGRNGEFAHILMEDVYWRTLRRMERVMVDGVGRVIDVSHANASGEPSAGSRGCGWA